MKTIKITQEIMDIIEAEPMYIEGTHVGYNKETGEVEIAWYDVYIDVPGGQILVDFTWFYDNSDASVNAGRGEYSVKIGDEVEVLP